MFNLAERFDERFQVWRTGHMRGVGEATVILAIAVYPNDLVGEYFILVPKPGSDSSTLDVSCDLIEGRIRFGSFPEELAGEKVDSDFALGWLRGIAESDLIDRIEKRWTDAVSPPPFAPPDVKLQQASVVHLAQMRASGRGEDQLIDVYGRTRCDPLRNAMESALRVTRMKLFPRGE